MSPLKPQHTYSVMPGPGRPAECRVTVLEARVTVAGDLSYQDARAMGYRTSGKAKAAWVRTHDRQWVKRELVDLADAFDDGCSVVDWLLVKRFDTHWAHRPVQVVVVKRVVDEPRFMARPGRGIITADGNADYTRTRGLAVDDLEAIDAATQERYSRQASERDAAVRASFQRDLAAEQAKRKAERGRSMRLPPYARRAA